MSEKDYVLGTNDEEIARLALQHRVWRPRALDGWRRAGFTVGQTILDIGSGPGNASFDLSDIVGDSGKVVALDRSRRFLDALEHSCRIRGRANIEVHEVDLDQGALPDIGADGAWCRWVLAFVQQPKRLLEKITNAVRPGGVFVSHEYLHYRTWKLSPRSIEHEVFVDAVVKGWKESGGEPDIGADIPVWLESLGWELKETRTIMDIVKPDNFVWQWPKAFVASGAQRQVELGTMTQEQAAALAKVWENYETLPGAFTVTPVVIETIAVRK